MSAIGARWQSVDASRSCLIRGLGGLGWVVGQAGGNAESVQRVALFRAGKHTRARVSCSVQQHREYSEVLMQTQCAQAEAAHLWQLVKEWANGVAGTRGRM